MSVAVSNRLLSSLSPGLRASTVAQCVLVDLPLRTSLYEPEITPSYGYFMTSGMTSIVSVTSEGQVVEVGIVGAEGLVGGAHLLGPSRVTTRGFIQIDGNALRIPFSALKKLFLQSEELRTRILEFEQQQALTLSQVAACNSLHQTEARLARWLLMASDRTGSPVLRVTQEFLGMMLGASRTTVTITAGSLQKAGFMEYRWGEVKILDRKMLEATACDCYAVIRALHLSLYQMPYQESR